MASDIIVRMRQASQRLFRNREIYYRSGDQFHFVSISRRQQIIGTALLAVVVLLCGSTVAGLVVKDRTIAAKDARIARIADDYDLLAAHVRQVQDRLIALAEELEVKHKVLDELSEQNSSLQGRVGSLSQALDRTASELKVAQVDNSALEQRRSALKSSLEAAAAVVEDLAADRNMALREGERLKRQVVQLQSRLGLLEAAQQQLMSRIEKRAEINISELEALIEGAGLDVDALLERVEGEDEGEGGVGGPFVGLTSAPPGGEDTAGRGWSDMPGTADGVDEMAESLGRLERRLVRWSALKEVMGRLPLAAPVDVFWVSSNFGKRRDPMTRRWAMHYGVDLAGPSKQVVHSTAAGVVTAAGWSGPYGRMVEIDHGFGIKTRYAHLHRITVKKGQKVAFHEKLGLMGSTGRSTGSHVHYEIHFDDTPLDPGKLIKAGEHVFKVNDAE